MDPQQAASALMKLINGYQISQVIHVAATLGIADLLKDGPRRSADIAHATSTHSPSMYRFLHALASAGVLEEQADAFFSLTDIGQCLRSGSPQPRVAWGRATSDVLTFGNPGETCCTASRRARTRSATCMAAECGIGAPSSMTKAGISMLP